MFGINDEHDCNVVSTNSLNIHDANDMQSHKLGEVMFDEYDIFCPPRFDEQIYYDESMPPIYDDYCDDTYALKNNDNYRGYTPQYDPTGIVNQLGLGKPADGKPAES